MISRGEAPVLVHVLPRLEGEDLAVATATSREVSALHSDFTTLELELKGKAPQFKVRQVSKRKFALSVEGSFDEIGDLFLSVPYVGDRGLAFVGGELVADHFYYGRPWEISLKRFEAQLEGEEMIFVFHPMYERYEYMVDLEYSGLKPDFGVADTFLKIDPFRFETERRGVLVLGSKPER